MKDDATALGAVVHDRAAHGRIYPEYIRHLRTGHAASGKPVFLVSNRQGTGADPEVLEATRAGYPVLDGIASFLTGARCLLGYRDFLARPAVRPPGLPRPVLTQWRARLADRDVVDEIEANRFLHDCGIPMVETWPVNDSGELEALASGLGYPVVMKTAMPDIRHKSDVDGVRLNIRDAAELMSVYHDLSGRLGNRVLVAPMLDAPGVEMILGFAADEQFGPMVVMGIGGIHAELLQDFVTVRRAVRCCHSVSALPGRFENEKTAGRQ